jgi:hypothetical protein
MGLEGVIGYIAITSLSAWATWAAALLPSIITMFFSAIVFLFSFCTEGFGTDLVSFYITLLNRKMQGRTKAKSFFLTFLRRGLRINP